MTAITQSYETLKLEFHDSIAHVTFNREKDTNAFSRTMTLELLDVCRRITEDGRSATPRFDALVLTGGTGRSFSVGGDFHDVGALAEEGEIRRYLGEIIDLYIAILRVEIPVVAAIDRFAIGQGLQVALMTDWRIGTTACQLQMPELKNGVACPLGSIILESLFGRAKMLELVLDCEFLDAKTSRAHGLLNRLTAPEELQAAGLEAARRFAAYPRMSYVATKRVHNERFVTAMESVREASSRAHVDAFLRKTGKKHFDKVLGRTSNAA
jgi:enoyl-CoA hydratase/carnithine racemase